MKRTTRFIALVLGSAVGSFVVMRLLARRINLPCPAALAWVLDNPVTRRIAGAELLLDRAGVRAGMRLLDAGCGPGRVAVPAALRVGASGEVVCLDIQEAMLRKARRKADEAGVQNMHFLHGCIEDGLTPSEEFDRAMLVTVLGEIPDRLGALEEIYCALKPGGVLSITEVRIGDPHYQSFRTVKQLVELVGFTIGEVYSSRWAYTVNCVKAR